MTASCTDTATADLPSPSGSSPASAGVPAGLLLAMVAGGIMPVLDSTIVAIGMQALIEDFHSTTTAMQWVTTAYLLALAVAVPLVGWGQARFGGKRLWMSALVLFLIGSLACAASPNVTVLITARIVQGIGAGLILALMQSLPVQEAGAHGPAAVTRTVAIISVTMAAGPILGPVLGGIVLEWLPWRWLFLINLPFGIIALIAGAMLVHDQAPNTQARPRPHLDVVGLLLVGAGIAALLLALSNTAEMGGVMHSEVLIPLAFGVIAIAAFFAWPATRDPQRAVINIALLHKRSIAAGMGVAALAMACMYGAQFLLPLFWQEVYGTSPLKAAILLIPQGIGTLMTRTVAARLTAKHGSRPVAMAAFSLVALTTIPLVFAPASTSPLVLSAILFLRGLALGALLIPVFLVAYIDASEDEIPHATMITRTGQQIGASFGTALAACVLMAAAGHAGQTAMGDFHWAFLSSVIVTAIGAAATLTLPAQITHSHETPVHDTE